MANFLIVAGTSTIAVETARQLIAKGHQVIITGRLQDKTKKIALDLACGYLIGDPCQFKEIDRIFTEAIKLIGPLDGVVNCAGSILLKPCAIVSQDEYNATIAANLTTAFAVVQASSKHMTLQGGSVVLLATAAALRGVAMHECIAAAKAGIIGLALSAAASFANKQLRYNVIAPGLVDTALTKQITDNEMSLSASKHMHPLGRIGNKADIAQAIVFFLDPSNSWITGQVLAVDGGLSAIVPKYKAL